MLGNVNMGFPNNQFQGYMVSGNPNQAFMGGVPCFAPPMPFPQMVSIHTAHLRAMSGFFQPQDAAFSPIVNTMQSQSPPPGTHQKNIADYDNNSYNTSNSVRNDSHIPFGIHQKDLADYDMNPSMDYYERFRYQGDTASCHGQNNLNSRNNYDTSNSVRNDDSNRPGLYRNDNAGYGNNHSNSVNNSNSIPSGIHQKDLADYTPNPTPEEIEAKRVISIVGEDGKYKTFYPNGDGTYCKGTRTGGKEHDKSGNLKLYHRTQVTNDDGDLDDVFVEARNPQKNSPGSNNSLSDKGYSHQVSNPNNIGFSSESSVRNNSSIPSGIHQKDLADYTPNPTPEQIEAKRVISIVGEDGKYKTFYPNGDGTYCKGTRTGGKEHDKSGNLKLYHRTHVTNADGDLDDVFVAQS